jgi:hypothetical protein
VDRSMLPVGGGRRKVCVCTRAERVEGRARGRREEEATVPYSAGKLAGGGQCVHWLPGLPFGLVYTFPPSLHTHTYM